MPLPHWVARFNKVVTNRFMEPLARRFSNFAVVHHIGRNSGRAYATPVNCFVASSDSLIVALTYGRRADWVRNVRAGGGTMDFDGTELTIDSAALIDRTAAWPHLPIVVRVVLRVLRVDEFLLVASRPRSDS